jgi:phosphoenolpyruvate carboxylase
VASGERAERIELLQRMHRQWPFFRTLLSNLDMVLAKSDLRIAQRYMELVEDKKLARRIFRGHQGRVAACPRRAGADHRRGRPPAEPTRRWRAAIAHRFPYLDPLNHLQVELLRRYRNRPRRRKGVDGVERLQRGIHLSINGIAAGCATPVETLFGQGRLDRRDLPP